METRRKYVVGMVAIGCILAMLYLLWNQQMNDFYTVLIGAAYFYMDRVYKEPQEEHDNTGDEG